MTATLPSTTARRLSTLSSCVVGVICVLYFLIPWMMGVAPPNPYDTPGKILTCVLGVNCGLNLWVLGWQRTAVFVTGFGAIVFALVLIGLA